MGSVQCSFVDGWAGLLRRSAGSPGEDGAVERAVGRQIWGQFDAAAGRGAG